MEDTERPAPKDIEKWQEQVSARRTELFPMKKLVRKGGPQLSFWKGKSFSLQEYFETSIRTEFILKDPRRHFVGMEKC